jgi:hypothetical protein
MSKIRVMEEMLLPVFLCFFILQGALLGHIRNRCSYGRISPYQLKCKEPLRCRLSRLDEAALLEAREQPMIRSLSLFNAGSLVTSLYNLSEGQESLLSHSTLCKALELLSPVGFDVEELRDRVRHIISLQHYSGWLPDFFKGDIMLKGACSCGFLLPLALGSYCHYTGDFSILGEEKNYNEYGGGDLERAKSSILFDAAHEHAVRALLSVRENCYGLPFFEYQGSAFETMGLEEEFSDMLAALLYIRSADSFLEFAGDYKIKLKLIEKANGFLSGLKGKAKLFGAHGTESPSSLACLSILIAAGKRPGEEIIDKAASSCERALKEGRLKPLYALLLSRGLIEGDFVDQAISVLNALKEYSLNPIERALLKEIVIGGLCGVGFKFGRIKVTPRFEKYRMMFPYKRFNVDIDYAFRFWDGVEINGLKYNNLDYADLKGYNRDISIRL